MVLGHRSDLQGLRGIAILLVVLSHAKVRGFEAGFIGVDVFFVLSGYLITKIIVEELNASNRIDLLRFYARRIQRLFPPLVMMVVISCLVASYLYAGVHAVSITGSADYAITWLSNFYFLLLNRPYFGDDAGSDLFLHTWSLSVEEQFYLVWPATIFLFYCFRKKIGKIEIPLILGGLLFSLSLTACIITTEINQLWSFYFMPSRGWQFALGAAALYVNIRPDLNIPSKFHLQLFGLILIVFSIVFIDSSQMYPSWRAFFPSIGTALILLRREASAGLILSNRVLIWIGDRSYSLYLWHWPVFIFAGLPLASASWLIQFLGIIASLAIAAISFKLVEYPFWKGRFSGKKPLVVIGLFVFTMLLSLLTLWFIKTHNIIRSGESFPVELKGVLNDKPGLYATSCDSWYESPHLIECIRDPDQSKFKHLVLVGDSVLIQWYSAIEKIYPSSAWKITVLTKSSCPVFGLEFFYTTIGKKYLVCDEWKNYVHDFIAKKSPDLIITGSSTDYPFTLDEWKRGVLEHIPKLAEHTGQLIVIGGTPKLEFNGPLCLLKLAERNDGKGLSSLRGGCRSIIAYGVAKQVTDVISDALLEVSNARLIDLNTLVCPKKVCDAMSKFGLITYRDKSHLTDTFVKSLIPEVREMLLVESTGSNLEKAKALSK